MEDTLRARIGMSLEIPLMVLILVLMKDTLRERVQSIQKHQNMS